jgi:hypothetical protein
VNGVKQAPETLHGFAEITREWKSGDTVAINFDMPVRRVAGNPKIAATRGLVALERGPIVYAFEGLDNSGSVFDIVLPPTANTSAEHRAMLGGVTVLNIPTAAKAWRQDDGELAIKSANLTAIPYALWANRGLTPMTVWVARDGKHARVLPKPTLTSTAKVTTSFHRAGMDPALLNDQLMPQNGTDGFAQDFDFWPHKGSAEWASYEFKEPARVHGATVSWFDDTGTGECRLPTSWRLLYRTEAGEWKPVTGASEYLIRKTEPVKVTFDPVTTKALRLEVQLPERFSAGLYEWGLE